MHPIRKPLHRGNNMRLSSKRLTSHVVLGKCPEAQFPACKMQGEARWSLSLRRAFQALCSLMDTLPPNPTRALSSVQTYPLIGCTTCCSSLCPLLWHFHLARRDLSHIHPISFSSSLILAHLSGFSLDPSSSWRSLITSTHGELSLLLKPCSLSCVWLHHCNQCSLGVRHCARCLSYIILVLK